MWEVGEAAIHMDVPVGKQERLAAPLRVLFPELVKGRMRDVRPALDLDGQDIMPSGQPRFRQQEVNLHAVFRMASSPPCHACLQYPSCALTSPSGLNCSCTQSTPYMTGYMEASKTTSKKKKQTKTTAEKAAVPDASASVQKSNRPRLATFRRVPLQYTPRIPTARCPWC